MKAGEIVEDKRVHFKKHELPTGNKKTAKIFKWNFKENHSPINGIIDLKGRKLLLNYIFNSCHA
ncbi:MAG TPA: hypothetical protein DDW50_22910 [Firmicutes bacterium]|jgi:hypothetical protein|nr:hypothetical protein [Bacillota bacterium]